MLRFGSALTERAQQDTPHWARNRLDSASPMPGNPTGPTRLWQSILVAPRSRSDNFGRRLFFRVGIEPLGSGLLIAGRSGGKPIRPSQALAARAEDAREKNQRGCHLRHDRAPNTAIGGVKSSGDARRRIIGASHNRRKTESAGPFFVRCLLAPTSGSGDGTLQPI